MNIKVCSYSKGKMGENRTRYTLNNTNKSGEKIVIDLTKCVWGSLQDLWITKGYMAKKLNNWISIEVYVTDKDSKCWGKYNPQIKDRKINFDWVLEDTPVNRDIILTEICKRAEIIWK